MPLAGVTTYVAADSAATTSSQETATTATSRLGRQRIASTSPRRCLAP